MKKKQAFIFFVSDSPYEWQRNQEIFLFYLNRINVNEDDQCEVISVKDVAYWDYDPWSKGRLNRRLNDDEDFSIMKQQNIINEALYSYESQVKKGFVSKFCFILLHVIIFCLKIFLYWSGIKKVYYE